jgi:hypothetical protein
MEEDLSAVIALGLAFVCFYTWGVYKVGFKRGHRAGFKYGFAVAEMRQDGFIWASGYVQGVEYRKKAEPSFLQ